MKRGAADSPRSFVAVRKENVGMLGWRDRDLGIGVGVGVGVGPVCRATRGQKTTRKKEQSVQFLGKHRVRGGAGLTHGTPTSRR